MDDPATVSAVQHIIRTQFDYEIMLKQRELHHIRTLLDRGANMLQHLHYSLINGISAAPSRHPSPIPASRPSSPVPLPQISASSPLPLPQISASGRPMRMAVSQHRAAVRAAEYLISRRDDGAYVRISCPVCHRHNFANMQGFLNHCRLKHQTEFPSHTEAARLCGTVVDEMEVPIDDPARRIAVKAAAFEKPTNFVWGQAHLPNPDDVEEMQQPAMPVPQVKERPKIKVYEEDVDMSPAEEPLSTPAPIPLLPLPDARANSLQENLGDLGDPMELDTLDEPQLLDIKLEADRTDNPAGASQNREEFGRSHGTEHIAEAEIVRTSTPNFDTSASEGSRFYVKRRVLLGNVSKYLAPDKRDTGLEKYAFKWMIYLQGPSGDEDISPFVRKVRFYLHPDYRPFDVIEVTDPPFRLTRYGWGEIPVRLQIYFADDRNKPVDLIHVLKLDKMKSGRQIPGSERFIDLELDRNTEFAEARQVEIAHKTELVAVGAESEASAKQEVLDRILHKLVKQFPIIHAPGSKSTNVPYSVAPSLSAYWSWVIGKRKAVEWARARLLSEALANTSGVHRSATVPEIVRWCLAHGYTPASMPPTDSMPSAKESAKKVYKEAYCPFCGAYGLHHEQTEECTVRPSMWKNRLWGLTQASDVLKQAGIESSLRLEGDELDLDVDTMFDRDRQLRNRGSYAHSWCNQEHPTAIARDLDFVNEEYERLRLPSPLQIDDDGSQISAGLIFEAARSFVRHLLHVATAAYREDNAMQQPHVADAMELSEAPVAEAAQKMSRPRLLVPYHIYRGISEARDSLDFLTGSGLARGSLSE